ncbi:MAG: hypothetical protein K0S82_22 [Gaiellaceae bacterium]|jgi:hypothetical protein|nr:hypothetical protein [Gaiellaceae bacterium]
MTTGLLLTYPFSDRDGKAADMEEAWAIWHERALRELRFRASLDQDDMLELREVTLTERVAARDAGDVCHVCGELVTWVDHLPPRDPFGAVRCFKNVRTLQPTQIEVIDILGRQV